MPYAGPTLPATESVSKNADKLRIARFQPWPMRLTALIFAALSALWLGEALFASERLCKRFSDSAIPISFVAYYSLLAAGALIGRRGRSFELRSWRLLAMMSWVAVSTLLAWWCQEIDSPWFVTIYLGIPAMLIVGTVFTNVKKLTGSSFAEEPRLFLSRLLQRFYALAIRIANPRLLLVVGALLIFISAWPPSLAGSLFLNPWITSSSDVSSWQWTPAVMVRDYGGRTVFLLNLALAFATVWLIAKSLWKRVPIGQLKLTPYLALLSALLLGYTQTDTFYAFLGLAGVYAGWLPYTAWLATAVAFLFNIAASRIHAATFDRRSAVYLLLLGFPILVRTCPMLPPFTSDGEYTITGAATSYLGVAVLAWGWLKANANRATPLTATPTQPEIALVDRSGC